MCVCVCVCVMLMRGDAQREAVLAACDAALGGAESVKLLVKQAGQAAEQDDAYVAEQEARERAEKEREQ